MNECKIFSETLYTELAHLFGKSLDLVDMNCGCRPRYLIKRSFRSTLFLALEVNTSLTSLDLSEKYIGDDEANLLFE